MMHRMLLNELVLDAVLEPEGPLLIKSGWGAAVVDPTLPDMNFVRQPTPQGEEVYIPGSSLRGVVRSHAERLLRSANGPKGACDIVSPMRSCADQDPVKNATSSEEVYRNSCAACRLFGHTRLAGRVFFSDLCPEGEVERVTRFGVAIDRRTGGVQPRKLFEMEAVVSGGFRGEIRLTNFTLDQLGLLAAAVLDIGDGLVPLGSGKSRGFGRVRLSWVQARYRSVRGGSRLLGVEPDL